VRRFIHHHPCCNNNNNTSLHLGIFHRNDFTVGARKVCVGIPESSSSSSLSPTIIFVNNNNNNNNNNIIWIPCTVKMNPLSPSPWACLPRDAAPYNGYSSVAITTTTTTK
jgi:hypothetical protein